MRNLRTRRKVRRLYTVFTPDAIFFFPMYQPPLASTSFPPRVVLTSYDTTKGGDMRFRENQVLQPGPPRAFYMLMAVPTAARSATKMPGAVVPAGLVLGT